MVKKLKYFISRTLLGFIILASIIGGFLLLQWANEQPWVRAVMYIIAVIIMIVGGISLCFITGTIIDGFKDE